MNLISLTHSRQTDGCDVHSMELYARNGKVCPLWLLPVAYATVGELEVEGGLGNTMVQQESL